MSYSPLVLSTRKSFFSFSFLVRESLSFTVNCLTFPDLPNPKVKPPVNPSPPNQRTLKIITSLLKFPDSTFKGSSTQMSLTILRIYRFGGSSFWVERKEGRERLKSLSQVSRSHEGNAPTLEASFFSRKTMFLVFPRKAQSLAPSGHLSEIPPPTLLARVTQALKKRK